MEPADIRCARSCATAILEPNARPLPGQGPMVTAHALLYKPGVPAAPAPSPFQNIRNTDPETPHLPAGQHLLMITPALLYKPGEPAASGPGPCTQTHKGNSSAHFHKPTFRSGSFGDSSRAGV
jgi:hypothetical protein